MEVKDSLRGFKFDYLELGGNVLDNYFVRIAKKIRRTRKGK